MIGLLCIPAQADDALAGFGAPEQTEDPNSWENSEPAPFSIRIRFDDKYDCYRNHKVKMLSGGDRRIAELYLILNSDAEFCILDEPFSNIAPVYDDKIRSMISEQKANKGIIVTDHIYEEILRVADDLFLLSDGFTYQIHSRDDLVRLGYIMS
jgi:ABC-type multidrug transport system ATPase subunit